MRGQLSIFKNNYHINNLWRGCSHLSKFNIRLYNYMHLRGNDMKSLHKLGFQSAEGCFSRIVTTYANLFKNISIYVSSSQFSDAFRGSSSDRETLSLGWALIRCNINPLLYNINNNNNHLEESFNDMSNITHVNNSNLKNNEYVVYKDLILENNK